MKYCTSCILPDSRPGLILDQAGVCSACRSFEHRSVIDWDQRRVAFRELAEQTRKSAGQYDCVIPVSGGKDSTWQVVTCLEHGLTPLCVTWKTPGRTAIGQRNLDNLVSLGVDHIDYQINPDVERKFVYKAFKANGIPGLPMHMALFNIPLNIAVRFDIPLIVWGENSASEYTGEDMHMGIQLDDAWIAKHGVTDGTTAEDWLDHELTRKRMAAYFGPPKARRTDVRGVFLGYFFQWDADAVYRIAKERGFESAQEAKTGHYDYADIDDDFIAVHHWIKWYKFGFTRTWDNLSLEIRNGRMSRDEAIQIIADKGDETPLGDIEKFCDFLGIQTSEFFDICEQFRDRSVWRNDGGNWVIDDFLIDDWTFT